MKPPNEHSVSAILLRADAPWQSANVIFELYDALLTTLSLL